MRLHEDNGMDRTPSRACIVDVGLCFKHGVTKLVIGRHGSFDQCCRMIGIHEMLRDQLRGDLT
ncbi:hypothetical protein D3C71_2164070 [compost metagenome]